MKREATLIAVTKEMRSRDGPKKSKFFDLRFLFPTYIIFERLLLKDGYRLRDLRRAIIPAKFKFQLYLLVNWDFLGIADVHALI